jgi:Protein of unknown function (DUF3592)
LRTFLIGFASFRAVFIATCRNFGYNFIPPRDSIKFRHRKRCLLKGNFRIGDHTGLILFQCGQGEKKYHCPHMPSILYKLRGIEKWPSVTATVASTEVVSSGGRSGKTMNVHFIFMTGSGEQKGMLFVDDNSSLYGLSEGEQFALQYNPANPSSNYCGEASSLSRTVRRTIAVVGVLFAITVFLIEYFGR